MPFPDDLAGRLSALLRELLEQEEQEAGGASELRCKELRHLIKRREKVLNDDSELDAWFRKYTDALPEEGRPKNPVQERRLYGEWEFNIESELEDWRVELLQLERQPINKQVVFDSVRSKTMRLLHREAQAAELLHHPPLPDSNRATDVAAKRSTSKAKEVSSMKKSAATKLVNSYLEEDVLDGTNTHFSNVNSAKEVWWFNIPPEKFEQDLHLLLCWGDDGLIWLTIEGNSVPSPERTFRLRPDRRLIDLEISCATERYMQDVKSGGTGYDFRPHVRREWPGNTK